MQSLLPKGQGEGEGVEGLGSSGTELELAGLGLHSSRGCCPGTPTG